MSPACARFSGQGPSGSPTSRRWASGHCQRRPSRADRGGPSLALSLYDLTTQVPHEIYLALPWEAERPRLAHPPVRLLWFTGRAFSKGVETHTLDGIDVRVYGAAKSVADCFKYRTSSLSMWPSRHCGSTCDVEVRARTTCFGTRATAGWRR